MREIDYFSLGGTLYVPSTHKNLKLILEREKYIYLTSIVICLEDSISNEEVSFALEILEGLNFKKSDLKVFIRPRSFEMLELIMKFENIGLFDGFVLPKITPLNVKKYIKLIGNKFYCMPTIETNLNEIELYELKKEFEFLKIISIRIGIEDILGSFGIVRDDESYFDNAIMYNYLMKIFFVFRPDYYLSAPVYPFINNSNIAVEVQKEIKMGILNKTIIHPKQVEKLVNLYKVEDKFVKIAKKLLDNRDAIFKSEDRMYEYQTHKKWAEIVLKRAKYYGVKDG